MRLLLVVVATVVPATTALAVKVPIPGVSQAEGDSPVNGVDAIAISPDGETIALVANLTPGSTTDRLYTTTLAGGAISQVTSSAEVDDVPAFTPDGQTIVYVDSDGGVDKVHRVPAAGGTGVVVDDLPVSFGFRLSADGQTVVALTRDGVDDVLRSFPLAGGTVNTLTTPTNGGDADSETFNLSPDGTEVFAATDEGLDSASETGLFRVSTAGGPATQIPLIVPPDRVGQNAFDIDTVYFTGSEIVFKSDYDVDDENRIYTLPITGGTPTEIAIDDFPTGADVDHFVISPDGNWIAFSADYDTINIFELFVVPFGGGEPVKVNDEFTAEAIDLDITGDAIPDISDGFIDSDILRDPAGRGIVWSPDSKKILYLADGEINEAYEIYVVDNPFIDFLPGDANNDGVVNTLDIDPFVLALTDPTQYAIDFPDVEINAVADINDDGDVNTLDIDPFVALLTGGGAVATAPEPAALTLPVVALLMAPARRRRRA